MGNFDSLTYHSVSRIGNRIEEILYWWSPYKSDVNTTTVNHEKSKKSTILRADNPKRVGKYFAVDKECCELDRIRRNISKHLSDRDKMLISGLNNEDFD